MQHSGRQSVTLYTILHSIYRLRTMTAALYVCYGRKYLVDRPVTFSVRAQDAG